MSCRRFRKTLLDYADGRLDTAGTEKIESHLSSCEGCRRAADMLSASGSALSDLKPVIMPPEAAARVSSNLAAVARGEKEAPRRSGSALSFLWSPRTLAAAGTGVAIILGIVLVVVAFTGPPSTRRRVTSDGYTGVATTPSAKGSSPAQEESAMKTALPPVASTILPVVKVSQNNYDENSLRSAFDELEIKKQIEKNCTMGNAISMGSLFRRKMADMMVDAGCDGAMLEAMITYLTSSEPVLLPYYAENAQFTGQAVYIIGLAGPRRMGETTKLSRTEVWVMSPDRFSSSPDSSIVFFLETKSE